MAWFILHIRSISRVFYRAVWINYTIRRVKVGVLISILLPSITSFAENQVVPINTSPIVVPVINGVGTLLVPFLQNSQTTLQSIESTDAVSSKGGTISKNDIKFVWERYNPSLSRPFKVQGYIEVHTTVALEFQTLYRSALLFRFPDKVETIEFGIEEIGTINIDISPRSFDVTLGIRQPRTIALDIKNTGNMTIRALSFLSSNLMDSTTQNRVIIPPEEILIDLKPGESTEIHINLPQPVFAGAYTGVLQIIIDERRNQTIPLTLHTRGPNIVSATAIIPSVLFLAALGAGLWLSKILEDWFGLGGLMRGQIILNLQQSERHMNRILDILAQLIILYSPDHFSSLKSRLEKTLIELKKVIEAALDTPEARLVNEAERFALAANKYRLQWDVLQMVLKQHREDPIRLNHTLLAVEAAPITLDLESYRKQLEAILESSTEAHTNNLLAGERIPPIVTPKNLHSRMNGMAWLYRIAIWLVVFMLVYEIFFANNAIFGAFLDYLGVFLLAVCITQTCTQFLTRFRSSFTRSK